MSLFFNFLAGGLAGLVVDLVLFPLDTLKTRLQSEQGFAKAGGFSGIYRGLGSVLAGSIPSAAVFFITYEGFKAQFYPIPGSPQEAIIQVVASVLGAVAACVVRVPVEVVKQRSQVTLDASQTSYSVLQDTLRKEGLPGLYRGFRITAVRDSAFSLTEFPLWEHFKYMYSAAGGGAPVTPGVSASLGAVAGAIAGFCTTPIDVAKTQMMLAESDSLTTRLGFFQSLLRVYHSGGLPALFKGALPRVGWISIGGFIFLGVYDLALDYSKNNM